MKKLILLLLFMMSSILVEAQIYYFRTTEFASKYKTGSSWTSWSNWQGSDMLMTMNFNTDVVTIYSPQTQVYRIIKYIRNYTDNSGGQQMEFSFIDQDNDRGHMRLRIERNGNSQVYIDFANLVFVYNVIRTY